MKKVTLIIAAFSVVISSQVPVPALEMSTHMAINTYIAQNPIILSTDADNNPIATFSLDSYFGPLSMCGVGHCPQSAILWAQGPQLEDWYLEVNLNTGGDWSWSKIRTSYYTALIHNA